MVGAVPVCPPASPHKGAFIVQSPHMICDFCMETPLRGRSGGHIGAAPTYFVWVDCVWVVDFVWVDYAWVVDAVWVDCVWVVLFVCLFVCWENGAHEPTPSVLYF